MREVRLFLLGALLVPSLHAATVIELTLAELVSGANVIFVGTALRQSTYPENDGVWRTTDFQIKEVLKGAPNTEYSVKQYGGILGGMAYAASGVPRLRIGKKYLLMLDQRHITGCLRLVPPLWICYTGTVKMV